ncbi:MAG TPA: hypothetical protein VGQ83_29315 [Polyangia bacterium]|jgi:hypothetical protein
MGRFVDLFALAALALVILLPRPGVEVKAAVARLDPKTEQRMAELQAALLGKPDDVETAVELSEIYRASMRPEWALATLGPFRTKAPDDYRIFSGIAFAHAERLELDAAYRTMAQAIRLCESGKGPTCGAAADARMRMIQTGLKRVADQKLDPKLQPAAVQEIMFQTLRQTKISPPRALPKAPKK